MDAINQEASECYKLTQFLPPGSCEGALYRAVSIARFSNSNVCEDVNLGHQNLVEFARADPPAASECFLRLVCFTFTPQKVLQSTRHLFDHVYTSFNLEEHAKYLVYHRATGIHVLKRRSNYLSFYLGMVSCRIVYTYHIPTNTTGGIIISDVHGLRNELWEFMTLPDLLPRLMHSANLAPHPYFIPCLYAVSLMISIRRTTENAFNGNAVPSQSSEAQLWAGRVHSLSRNSAGDVRKLSEVSDSIMPMLWQFQHIQRFCITVQEIQECFEEGVVRDLLDKTDCLLIKNAADEINDAMLLVKGQIDSETRKIKYWLKRGWTQMNIVSNTATRNDALASISLAKKATEDSSSMKIVAIMTMTFLPGTFFAALFSVPSLDWKDGDIVTNKFWVYWAFTLPSTVAVFILWFLLTKRGI